MILLNSIEIFGVFQFIFPFMWAIWFGRSSLYVVSIGVNLMATSKLSPQGSAGKEDELHA